MSSLQEATLYDELVELLVDSADAARLSSFRMSKEKQSRLDAMLKKDRLGTLTKDDSAELNAFENFEHLVRLVKARMLKKQSR